MQFKPLLLALLTALLAFGCASNGARHQQPRVNTGYVDFSATSGEELFWEISRFDKRSKKYERLYSKLKAPEGGVLRLAFTPGQHQVRVTFLNRLVAQPLETEVNVLEGRITPVRIALTPAGKSSVETRELMWGPRGTGRYGRRTEMGSDENTLYSLTVDVGQPTEHRPLKNSHEP
jgi:hypothetical protein